MTTGWLDPAYWVTKAAGWLAKVENPFLKNLLIRRFIRYYGVDMSLATRQQPDEFRNFEDFFTRELRQGLRTIDIGKNLIVSPVDGTVASCGSYVDKTLVQFKQTTTNIDALTGSSSLTAPSGQYAIIYLSPKDYHRIHAPFSANLIGFSRKGGKRYSVNPKNHASIQGLYERNVRVNSVWQLPQGEVYLSMVGALIVSSIQTKWDTLMPNLPEFDEVTIEPTQFQVGEEIGWFTLGSTVILVVPDTVGELSALSPGQSLRIGEAIGTLFDADPS